MWRPLTLLVLIVLTGSVGGCGDDDVGGAERAPSTSPTEQSAIGGSSVTTADSPTATSAEAAPPWGLPEIDMPDSREQIEALLAGLPGEIEGLPRAESAEGAGATAVHYGSGEEQGLILNVTPVEQFAQAFEVEETLTALDVMSALAEAMGMDELEGSSLDANQPLLWLAAGGTAETGPGVVETFYVATWAEPEGEWLFDVIAPSADLRTALIRVFIDTAES